MCIEGKSGDEAIIFIMYFYIYIFSLLHLFGESLFLWLNFLKF